MSENGRYTGPVYSFDNNPNAVEATEMNSKIFGMSERINAKEVDIVDLYFKDLETK